MDLALKKCDIMKQIQNFKQLLYYCCIIFLVLIFSSLNASKRYWVAASTGYWNNQANWSASNGGSGGASVPAANDEVIFNDKGQGNCVLTNDVEIADLKIEDYDGIIDLAGNTLTCTGEVEMESVIIDDSAGSGLFEINSSDKTKLKGVTINAQLSVVSEKVYLSNSIFNNIVEIEQTGNSTTNSKGGNTFNNHTTITKSGKGRMVFAKDNPDIFNADVLFYNLQQNYIDISYKAGTTLFNGDVYLNSSNSDGIRFGYGKGKTAFSATSTIQAGNIGFNSGTLYIENVSFNFFDSLALTMTSNARLKIIAGTHFNGPVYIKIPRIKLNNTVFNDNVTIEKTGNYNDANSGGNIFKKNLTIINNSTGLIRFTSSGSSTDYFEGDAYFIKNNTGHIYIAHKGTAVFEGNLYIKGTGDNKIFVGQNGGVMVFAGGNNQSINNLSNSASLPYFKKMRVDKSTGDVLLNTPLTISGKLILNNGNIISDTTNFLSFTNNAVVENASDYSHVNGVVVKKGNDEFIFPVGNGTTYKPIAISEPSSSNTVFLAEYKNTNPVDLYPNYSAESSIDHISNVEYWRLERYNTSSDVDVTLYWGAGSGNINNINELTVVGWDGNQWTNYGRDNVSGDTLSGSLSSESKPAVYKSFTLGSTSLDNSLPIELLYFNTLCGNDTVVVLSWATASEQNNDYFTIYKSLDGIEWTELAVVSGSGNSSTLKEYRFNDHNLRNEDARYFYKLRQTDYDGNYKEFDMQAVFCRQNLKAVKLYPNPVSHNLNLQFNNVYHIDSPLDVLLYNASGRITHRFSSKVSDGQVSLNIDLPDLPSGTYYLQVKLGTIYFYTSPLVVEQ